jgi:hypothetical protein
MGSLQPAFFLKQSPDSQKKGCKRRREEEEEEGFMILNMMRKTYELMGFMGERDGFVVVQTESNFAKHKFKKGSYELIA